MLNTLINKGDSKRRVKESNPQSLSISENVVIRFATLTNGNKLFHKQFHNLLRISMGMLQVKPESGDTLAKTVVKRTKNCIDIIALWV